MAIRNPEVVNARISESEEYLHKHQILELFEDLCTIITYQRPDDLKTFLIKELRNRKERGPAGHIVFTDKEIQNVFTLFDLRQEARLSHDQCKDALKTIAHSSYQFNKINSIQIPESVDVATFQRLCQDVLG
jgi:Trm5-related predicted tRNA methylase